MKIVLTLISLFYTQLAFNQDCNCTETFAWLKETFEKNDAGFQYVVEQKGESIYHNHTLLFEEKVKSITTDEACAEVLSEWLQFFRKCHLWFGIKQQQDTVIQVGWNKQIDSKAIKQQFKNWESYPYKDKEFNNYISQLKSPGIEGIWSSPPYTIGIKKVKEEYIGFIIESGSDYWTKSQVKIKIRNENNKLKATYYMQDHSAREIENVNLIGNNYLELGWFCLKRISPVFPDDVYSDIYYKSKETYTPFFEKINDKTAYLRIPSFSHSEKEAIDSVIAANLSTILRLENFVIDLRYNGGGSDYSFQNLLPIIYTNPVTEVGVEYLSTELNNSRMIEFMSDPYFTEEDKKWAKESFETLNKSLGKFVDLSDSSDDVVTFDTIYPFPKNVGIIINQGNGSTTEQFLLAAKQSKKVKLFGTTTFGCLDISNMYFVDAPCKSFQLGYCLTKSKRIPDFIIDGKGLQPDFFIDNSVLEHEWLKYVTSILGH